ncbi:MAG: interleukin-like EMT inducer domain-containing protein [Anaerolineae bacterium]
MSDSRHRRLTHLLVLLAYALLAIVMTWPLVRHLATHVPGSYTWAFDEYTFIWNTWWLRYTLFDLGQNPLYTSYIFYPLGISLVLYTYNLFNALISLPFQAFLPLPAISNLTFLLATVLSGYGTFSLLNYIIGLPEHEPAADRGSRSKAPLLVASFLGGLIYAFGSYRMVYAAIGHYDMWSTAWIPLYALFLLKTIREPRMRNAVLAGIFLVLGMLSEMIFGVFLGLLTLILLAFALRRGERSRIAGAVPGLLRRLVVLGLVAVVLYAPILVPILREMFGGYELAGWGDAEKLSVDLMGLFTPTALHPLGGDWTETLRQTREGTSRFRDVNTVFLGWAGLALALVGAVRYRRRLVAWITSFVVFTAFSLGPLLQINGKSEFNLDGLTTTVPLPFILLHYIPVVKANRVPNRFAVVLMLALAVMAGYGAYWLLKKIVGRDQRPTRLFVATVSVLLVGLVLFEHWSVPLPLTNARIPPVYEQVAAELGDFAILQLPMGWRNSFGVQGAESTQTQYYQTYHNKRLLSGNISRNPPFKFEYFRKVPILDSLIAIQTYEDVDAERRAADRSTAGEFVSFYDIRYVVVAPGVPGRPPYIDTRDEALAYIEEVLPVVQVYDRDGWLLYQVDRPPLASPFTVDFGALEPRTAMVLGEGWAGAEEIQGATANWATAQGAQAFLPAQEPADHRLAITALPFDYPDAQPQQVTPSINGHPLEPTTLSPGWQTHSWQVPASLVKTGLNEVAFEFERLERPADVLPGNGVIGATGIQAPVAIEVNSGGPAGFAYITIGEGDRSEDGSEHRAGYNVAALDPQTGRLLKREGFDTTPGGSDAEATALADFIAAVPQGQIVVVALQADGAARLNETAIGALHSIGGQADPRGSSGWSHAVVGVKGAAPGTALEVAGPDTGWLRVAPDRRTLAIALDTVVWEQAE